jgi:putative membrane protein insertion efficiency factor
MSLVSSCGCAGLCRVILTALFLGLCAPALAAKRQAPYPGQQQPAQVSWPQRIKTAPQALALSSIRLYQKTLSPLLSRVGVRCIYTPTCSHYGCEAIRKHGVLKGGALAAWRVLRCNQFAKGGHDPVPEPRKR